MSSVIFFADSHFVLRAYTVEQFQHMLAQVPFASSRIEETQVGVGVWFNK